MNGSPQPAPFPGSLAGGRSRSPGSRRHWPSHTQRVRGYRHPELEPSSPQGPSRCHPPWRDTELCREIPLNLGTSGARALGEMKRERAGGRQGSHRSGLMGPARTDPGRVGAAPMSPPVLLPRPTQARALGRDLHPMAGCPSVSGSSTRAPSGTGELRCWQPRRPAPIDPRPSRIKAR